MNPEELRFIAALAEAGDKHSEKVARITLSLSVHLMPLEFLVETCEEFADYIELCDLAGTETR